MMLTHDALRILRYLATAHAVNPRAEVPLIELERELGLGETEARELVEMLVSRGLAQADLFPVNVWVQITEDGVEHSEGHVP